LLEVLFLGKQIVQLTCISNYMKKKKKISTSGQKRKQLLENEIKLNLKQIIKGEVARKVELEKHTLLLFWKDGDGTRGRGNPLRLSESHNLTNQFCKHFVDVYSSLC